MEENKDKKVIDLGILTNSKTSGVAEIALVEEPAIELDFLYFKKEDFRLAVHCVCDECGWDWDLADGGDDPYVCHKCGCDNELTIKESLGLEDACWKGYEPIGTKRKNGREVPNCVPVKNEKFESYNDYPKSAANAAKRALEFRDKNPDVKCGTAVGWTRANQLAKGENISEETIARMASFARHLQHKDVPYTEGCGGLMVDAWGGQAGIEWASNKLKEIRGEEFVKPKGAEDKDDFISRCIGVLVDEGNDADQAAAICYATWADRFEIDTTGLTPYADPGVKKKRIEDTYSADQLETILQLASVLGIDEKTVKMESHKFADVPEDSVTLYKYEGRLRDNSRSFCRRLMGLGRFYFKEEIEAMDTMNEEFGPGVGGGQYSIFKYKGGANCGHYWAKYTGFYDEKDNWRVVPAEPTSKEQRTAAEAPRTTIGRGYVKRPQRSLSPLALSKLEFKFADDEKRIVVGPAMIPDMEILRRTDDGKPYWVRFSEETIREIAMKYMKEARTNATNTDHETGERAGAYVYESWLVEDPETDKAKTIYGYDVPKGTWMIAMKIDNSETWKRVKAGELKGFSVEGAFADMEEIEAQKQYQKIMDILKRDI